MKIIYYLNKTITLQRYIVFYKLILDKHQSSTSDRLGKV